MPSFDDAVTAAAPPEEVWKLLYDPSRFPEWWVGVETVEAHGEDGYTMYPTGYPGFPMPQALRTDRAGSRVEISCLVSDLAFAWRPRPLGAGSSTQIAVHADIPDAEAPPLRG